HLPAELARFKEITMGRPVIMGRKTFESIGRALPGRQNIIITRDKNYKAEGCSVVSGLDEALEAAGDADEVFIIGGASIYELAMSKWLANMQVRMWLALVGVATLVIGASYAMVQQSTRLSADDLPLTSAQVAKQELQSGSNAGDVVPTLKSDLKYDTSVFMIIT